ncbi:hypothetical protein PQI07_25670 [Methylobacterium sp. 092160098-2]|uniref:hypothetical protein n=1 Tax=Methylobacterium sp. 092160098-2 TaxID=3025129 RepID=UPI002381AAE1|nr:hypothetical protein [Methylobacterium sp. 092160098-2]MDE4914064.1 hypothetical protein [Methylobacterium sp. 092160098-2]
MTSLPTLLGTGLAVAGVTSIPIGVSVSALATAVQGFLKKKSKNRQSKAQAAILKKSTYISSRLRAVEAGIYNHLVKTISVDEFRLLAYLYVRALENPREDAFEDRLQRAKTHAELQMLQVSLYELMLLGLVQTITLYESRHEDLRKRRWTTSPDLDGMRSDLIRKINSMDTSGTKTDNENAVNMHSIQASVNSRVVVTLSGAHCVKLFEAADELSFTNNVRRYY